MLVDSSTLGSLTHADQEQDDALGLDERLSLARIESTMFGEPPAAVCVDRYELQEQLGAGGMGVVHAAWDPELRRRVAIKLVQVGAVGSTGASRLLREAQAIARISHPNVIPVHDVGTYAANADEQRSDRRSVFVVMELVDGLDLDQFLAIKKPSWSAALELFLAAGHGLAAAHAAGILHRDFKPSNVLVGDDGRVRVLDFGLAQPITRAQTDDPSQPRVPSGMAPDDLHTRTGTMLGTPYFMAPEQLAGVEADERSDQYSFAVALYMGLFGRGPFARGSVDQLALAKRRGEILPVPPDSPVPDWLAKQVWRGLSPKAADRFASMQAMLHAIEGGRRRRRDLVRVTIGSAAVLAAVGLGLGLGRLPQPDAAPLAVPDTAAKTGVAAAQPDAVVAPPVLGFLPFGGGVKGDLAWIADGLPNLMAEELRDREGLRVLSYHQLKRAIGSTPESNWLGAAVDRGANHIISGEIISGELLHTGDTLEIHLLVRDVAGTTLFERRVPTDSLALADAARMLAREVGGTMLGRRLELPSAPSRPISYERTLQLGIAALESFSLKAAEQHLDEARRLAPEAAEARFYGAISAEWQGRGAEAEAEYELAAKGTLPTAKRMYVEGSLIRMKSGHSAALELFRRATVAHPDDIYLAYGLFEMLYHAGDGEGAMQQFARLNALAPRFGIPLLHVLDRAVAIGDTDAVEPALALARASGAADGFIEIWRARGQLLQGDLDGALAIIEAIAAENPDARDVALGIHAVQGDLTLVRARVTQGIDRGDASAALPDLALCTAMGDDDCRRIAVVRERARMIRATHSDLATLGWLSIVLHESLVEGSDLDPLVRVLDASTDPHMRRDIRFALAEMFIAGAQGDATRLAGASESPFAEVRLVADALMAAAAADHTHAVQQWRAALPLALSPRFVGAERFWLAKSLRALGDHAALRSTCDEIITPRAFDWSWGAIVGPCLLWSAEASAALGDVADARSRYEKLLAVRTRAGPRDAVIRAARDGLALLGR